MTSPVLIPAAGSTAPQPLLKVEGLKMYFPITSGMLLSRHVGDVRAVDGVDLSIEKGETVGLVGESGCGKSTVGRTILRLYRPTAGRVVFDGQDITEAEGETLRAVRRRMQMIFQDPYASLNPRMTAAGIVSEPMEIHKVGTARERRERVRDLLATVGMDPDYGDRFPHEFSGGQRQRIGIARALIMRPSLVVADEAVSALDVSVQAQVLNLLKDLQEEFKLTCIFVAHNLDVIRHVCDRVAVMYAGRIVELGTTAALFKDPRHPYTRALHSAVPRPDPDQRMNFEIIGEAADPGSLPSGCAFHPRCPQCFAPCQQHRPELKPAIGEAAGQTGDHLVACHLNDEACPKETQ